MTTSVQSGELGESAVCKYIEHQGFNILHRNWRRPSCEIDIVAKKNNTVYFIEVKFRTSSGQGDGFEYITKPKLGRMARAASLWVETYKWSGDYTLSVASVSGKDLSVNFIESITE